MLYFRSEGRQKPELNVHNGEGLVAGQDQATFNVTRDRWGPGSATVLSTYLCADSAVPPTAIRYKVTPNSNQTQVYLSLSLVKLIHSSDLRR